jgi:hypothetical protein
MHAQFTRNLVVGAQAYGLDSAARMFACEQSYRAQPRTLTLLVGCRHGR